MAFLTKLINCVFKKDKMDSKRKPEFSFDSIINREDRSKDKFILKSEGKDDQSISAIVFDNAEFAELKDIAEEESQLIIAERKSHGVSSKRKKSIWEKIGI